MILAEKYAPVSAEAKDQVDKKVISDDAYAIAEIIEAKFNELRLASLFKRWW